MSKFSCSCGNVIALNEYPTAFEGWLLGCEAEEYFEDEISRQIADFYEAVRQDAKERWVEAFYGHAAELAGDAEIICDIVRRVKQRYLVAVIECPSCGRLSIQRAPGAGHYAFFIPEQQGYNGILKGLQRI